MQVYSISTPLLAIRLCRENAPDNAGVLSSLPPEAIVEIRGPSNLGTNMVEVSWQANRYAVFERDLKDRAEPATVEQSD
jgi:hypothetical protein